MLYMHLLTKAEQELYPHIRSSLFHGIAPFLGVQSLLFFSAAYFFQAYMTLTIFLGFVGFQAIFSFVLYKHSCHAFYNDWWANLETSTNLIIFILLYLFVGFMFWTAFMFYLLQVGCTDISMIMIFRGACAAFAVGFLGVFQRTFTAIIIITAIYTCISLYADFGDKAATYIFQLFCIHLFDYLLLRSQNSRLLTTLNIKSTNSALIDALKQKNLELAKANQAQSRYLSAASHDLRQPLHALALITNDVQRQNCNPAITLPLIRMEQAIESLSKSFNAMLNLSRLDAGVIRPNMQTFPVQRLYERLLVEFETTAFNKGLSLIVVPSKAFVVTDEDILYSILSNFVSNAIRYTEYGGIVIGTRRDKNNVNLMVYDTGIGIPKDKLTQVFKEYQQLDYGEQRVTGGVGLGLAISERMTMLLGAHFVVRSKLDYGSAFGICLPRAAHPKLLLDVINTKASNANDLVGKKVVVLDDYKLTIEKLDELLRSWGMEVSVVLSSEMLQQIIDTQGPVDVILSDYHLGLARENGLDIMCYAKQIQPEHPPFCVLLTGDTTIDLLEKTRDLGVYLQHKPMSPARLRGFLSALFKDVD